MKIRNAFIEKPEPKLKPELDADIERARVLTARLALRRPRSDQTMADYAAKARRLSALAGVDDLLDERLIGTVERKGRARSSFEAYRAALIANVDKELRSALANLTKLQATPNVDNEIERERRRIAAGVKILDHYQPDLDGNFSIRDWAAKPEHERKRTLWPGPTASYDVEERRTNDKRTDLGRFRRRVDGWLDRYWKRAQGSAYCPLVALAMTTGCRPVEMVVHPVREMNGVRVWVEHGRLNFDIPAGKLSVSHDAKHDKGTPRINWVPLNQPDAPWVDYLADLARQRGGAMRIVYGDGSNPRADTKRIFGAFRHIGELEFAKEIAKGKVVPSITPYVFRHMAAALAKDQLPPEQVQEWLGQMGPKTPSCYGSRRQARGAGSMKLGGAKAARPVRAKCRAYSGPTLK